MGFYYSFVVLTVLLLHWESVLCQQPRCNDCIAVSGCPAVQTLLNNPDKVKVLRSAFCGFNSDGAPQICCSLLSEENVDTHRNLALLPRTCGLSATDKIIGGHEATLNQFPWMVLISYRTRDGLKFQCGGSLINDRYVLTAAHCVKDLNIAGVRVGEHNIGTDNDCQGKPPKHICQNRIQDIRVVELISHPDYVGKPSPVQNDIGLLRLAKPVDFTAKNADAICLPTTQELRNRVLDNTNATIAGWGVTEQGYVSTILLTTFVPIHTADSCRRYYNRGSPTDVTVNKICAGVNGHDSCGGDSGGPLMVTGLYNGARRYIVHGIVSYGPKQCGSDFPGVYTDVTKYMPWILDNIKP